MNEKRPAKLKKSGRPNLEIPKRQKYLIFTKEHPHFGRLRAAEVHSKRQFLRPSDRPKNVRSSCVIKFN
jgi:hypothetical protein